MTTKSAAPRTKKKAAAPKKPSPPAPTVTSVPVLDRDDIHRILADLTRDIAPADVETLMGNEDEIRRRFDELGSPELALFKAQLALALDCLRDHVDGECPQIPYYTISLLGAAVMYFSDEFDVVPDFLPNVGKLDDASVMAMAFDLAADGLRRYCTATGRSLRGLLSGRAPR